MNPAQADLIHILAPPPAPDSAKGKADLRRVLEAQHHRTPAEVRSLQADVQLSVFRFADVMGPAFKTENLPFTTQFFARTLADDAHAIGPAKSYFNRPRPFFANHEVKPFVGATMTYGAYPSGHATFACATAILLAEMVPEKAVAIFERADRYAENRVIGGVHHPTDIEAGRIAGSVIDNVLLRDPRFESDFARATTEVRHALGLGHLNPVNRGPPRLRLEERRSLILTQLASGKAGCIGNKSDSRQMHACYAANEKIPRTEDLLADRPS